PTHNWGTGAPVNGFPSDYFSVRWTTYYTLEAGSYTASVEADDGVRLFVNGTLLIDEWHQASGQPYSKTFTLGAGTHNVVIEYYEAGGSAYLDYTLTRGTSQTTPPITGAAATVTAYSLNLRDAPSAYTGRVITRIRRGETYAIVGRNATSTWWQLNVNGTLGWASGTYLATVNTSNVPVSWGTGTQPTATPVYTGTQCPGFLPSRLTIGARGRVTPGLPNNIRSQPTTGSVAIGQIPAGGVFDVLGGPVCNQSSAWWQVRYAGVTGWTMEGQYSTYWLEPY
ncbi:MAG: SH3 domain-containing protein, partial [Anaerolineae bacterium]|nr:SH3 domain-containing protein [Anaerolineae bacterium]